MTTKFLARSNLTSWLEELSADYAVHAPERNGTAVLYRPWFLAKGEPELMERPTESAKHVLFPRSEPLFFFTRTPGGAVSLQEAKAGGPCLVFGLLPCDARGFTLFDPVYGGGNTGGKAPDPYYLKRREAAVLIARACRSPLSTCFCNWVGGDPAGQEGADVLATDTLSKDGQGGFLLVPVTGKGRDVLGSALLRDAVEAEIIEAEALQARCRDRFRPAPDISGAPTALLKAFENEAFWEAQSASCLSCGVCTYLCPTCHCFDITDEEAGNAGVRLRSWDTCMAFRYTLEASGHNPRPGKPARLRNRVGHKFAYYPQREGGRMLCTGCGRCVKSCPASVDIRKIVLDALKEVEDVRQ